MDVAQLRQMLIKYFDESEIRDLCFDLQVDYESLPGQGKGDKARELIAHLERRERLAELVAACARMRPKVTWPDVPGRRAEIPESTGVMSGQMSNPFTYGNPIRDPARFFGRKREVEQVFSRLCNPEAESSSLVGGRRVGKTSLLHYLAHPDVRRRFGLDPDQFIFVYVDLQMVDQSTTPERLWDRLLGQMARHCKDVEVKYALKEVRESGVIDNFALADVFDTIDHKEQHVVFLLDEFEHVTENANFGPDYFYALRSLAIQHNLSLVTSSHHQLIDLTHSEAIRSSPFFNIFANINVSLFSEAEARELISTSLDGTGVRFIDSEIDTILRIAGTYPYFLQAACHFLFQAYANDLGADERLVYMAEEFSREAAPHLAHYWHDSRDQEQIVLAALALLTRQSSARQQTFSLAQLNGLYTRSEQTLARLEKRGLLRAPIDGYALFNTTFGEWIVSELTDPTGDQQGYEEWLQSNRSVLERLSSRTRQELGDILPRISGEYRDLIIAWAGTPGDLGSIAGLLKNALGQESAR